MTEDVKKSSVSDENTERTDEKGRAQDELKDNVAQRGEQEREQGDAAAQVDDATGEENEQKVDKDRAKESTPEDKSQGKSELAANTKGEKAGDGAETDSDSEESEGGSEAKKDADAVPTSSAEESEEEKEAVKPESKEEDEEKKDSAHDEGDKKSVDDAADAAQKGAEDTTHNGADSTKEKTCDDGIDTIEIEIKADASKSKREEFQAEIREQIENCKFEIISELQEHIHDELDYFQKQARKLERRRRASVIVRNIIILLLAAAVGFFGYCLYDAKYFAFMKSECEKNGTCEEAQQQPALDPEVKNAEWYKQNYGYLFESLQTKLNADKVSAYYLYTGDYKVNEIEPEYLLGMAYNRLNSNITYDSNDGIVIPANDLRQAYMDLVGNADNFAKVNFPYHCADFEYRKASDDFAAKSLLCADTAERKIVEEIEEIYEEGNVLYFLTTAAIYDKTSESFYTFDNLFKPAVKNVTEDDLIKHKTALNQYQYQFKKADGKYHFSGVVKLK